MQNKSIFKKRINDLRTKIKNADADLCLITGEDFHLSEYSGEYFNERKFFSGFTGSAGSLVVTKDEAFLFTDGRYFTQAKVELEDTGVVLMKSGTKGVPTLEEHIREHVREGLVQNKKVTLAVDGRTVSAEFGQALDKIQGLELITDFAPAEGIWSNRPAFPSSEIFCLDERYTGETAKSKIDRVRQELIKSGVDLHVIASLDDIAWLLNLRGSDVACNPVFMSYVILGQDEVLLFVQKDSLTDEVRSYLKNTGVSIRDYEDFYRVCEEKIKTGNIFFADKKRINYRIFKTIEDEKTIFKENPTMLFKAVKNDTEIKNLIDIHREDGACVTRLMMWVKELEDKEKTELDAAEFVDFQRKNIKDFFDLSFPTISAYGANAAMMHYSATPENNALIKKGGMLLVDSGGQYLRGTTDVTRTFAVGDVSDDMKKAFTLTLKGMLALSSVVFLKGCSGYSLDILAREALWREGIDYQCGTGHGVGYMLNVHEAPNAFRWKYVPGVSKITEILPGMVTTDEPGVYKEGEYGIRIENELLCEKAFENEYGTFLRFKILTLAPIDQDLIDTRYLNDDDLERLNDYHKKVREELMPLMKNDKEREFLERYTKKRNANESI